MKKQKGFTLIELLVVITIIAVLATIGLTIYTSAQKQARDAKRRGDIDAIAKALETKKGTNPQYQTLSSTDFINGIPTDSTTAKYCINSADGDPPLSSGITSWSSGAVCPSSGYVEIRTGSEGLPRLGWTICARLEESGTSSTFETGLKVYCQSSRR